MHNFHQVFHAAIKLCVCAARKTLIPLPHAPSRPVLETDRCAHQKQTDTLTETTEQWPRVSAVPYLGDDLPGGRQVQTAYGSIRVFEWGPEEGEKLLIVHGLSTPCIALGSLGKSFVSKGYRVMMFDLFGRGYSGSPDKLMHDARLYTTNILLVLSSSPLSWTGSSAFHLIGFSLGGSIAVAFAAYHSNMLASITLVCPGGLIRKSHLDRQSRLLYFSRVIPEWLRLRLLRRNLQPQSGAPSADTLVGRTKTNMDFDEIPILGHRPNVKIGDVIRWQLDVNSGFVRSYLSTVESGLVYRHYETTWRLLGEQLACRRKFGAPPGLPGGRICLILADMDVIVVKDEFIEDSKQLLAEDDIDLHVVEGGHEFVVLRGEDVASIAVKSWSHYQSENTAGHSQSHPLD